jgi:predicted Zn finger-like uncharacterized protein
MLIDCPSCGTRYRISGDNLRPDGSKLKCTRCGHIFVGSVYDAMVEDVASEGAQEESSERTASDFEGIGEEETGRAEKGKPRRRIRLLLLFLFLLLLAAAAFGYIRYTGMTIQLSFLQQTSPRAETELDQRAESEEVVQDISLRNVSQYMVRNKHIGSILVIEGKAVNESGGPKEGIELKATVFDEQGEKLRDKEFVCGKSVSLAQLQSYTQKELESEFSSHLSRMSAAQQVETGEALPFMAVFYSPPQKMAEFSLEVLRARKAETS